MKNIFCLSVLSALMAAPAMAADATATATQAPPVSGQLVGRVDYPNFLSKHDVVYKTPAMDGYEGFPLGNGDVGAMFWQNPTGYTVQLNKCDLWDASGDTDGGEALRSAGRLTVDFGVPCHDFLYLGEFDSRLSMCKGMAQTRGEAPFLNTRSQAWVQADGHVFLLACEATGQGDLKATGVPVRIALERWGSRVMPMWYSTFNRNPAVGLGAARIQAEGRDVWLTEPLSYGPFTIAARVLGDAGARPEIIHAHRGEITLLAKPSQKFTVAVAVVKTQKAGDDTVKAARKLLDDCEARTTEQLREAHAKWWADFWGKSFVSIGNDYLENLYYMHLYIMGSASRGDYPMMFNGGLFLPNHDIRNWNHAYLWNIQQAYWSVAAAGHPELLKPFLDTYWRIKPACEQYAKARGAPGGYLLCEMHTLHGAMLGRDAYTMQNNFTPASQAAQFFDEYWRKTGDVAFLREKAYPMMKAAAEFYLKTLKWDAARNEYSLMSAPCEVWGSDEGNWHRNCITDMAMIRTSFARLVEISALLGVDEDKRKQWGDVLTKLPGWPVMGEKDKSVFGVAFNGDNKPIIAPLHNDSYARDCHPIFPSGALGLKDQGSPLFDVACRTIKAYPLNKFGAIEPLATAAARLGLGEDAEAHLLSSVRRLQHFPNGLFYNINHMFVNSRYKDLVKDPEFISQRDYITDRATRIQGFAPQTPFIQSGHEPHGILAATINEMLLQSQDGVIRVFPATPKAWPASFQLLANGAFWVSSSRAPGKPAAFVMIESRMGNPCRMENPWPGQAAQLVEIGGKTTSLPALAEFSFPTQKDAGYILRPETEAKNPLVLPAFTGKQNEGAKHLQEATLGKKRDF